MLDLKKNQSDTKGHNLNFKFRDFYLYIVFLMRLRIVHVLITSNAFCSYIMRSGFKSYDLNEA